jgi:hypothetical protein
MSDEHNLQQLLLQARNQIHDLQTQITHMQIEHQRALDEAAAQYLALQSQFELKFGDPVEEGIAKGPPLYVTMQDNVQHLTLEEARLHLIALMSGISRVQAQGLLQNVDTVVPLLQRASGRTPPPPPQAAAAVEPEKHE